MRRSRQATACETSSCLELGPISRRRKRAGCWMRRWRPPAFMISGLRGRGRSRGHVNPKMAGWCGHGCAGRAMPEPMTPAGHPKWRGSHAGCKLGNPAEMCTRSCNWGWTPMAAAGAAEQGTRRTGKPSKNPCARCRGCHGLVLCGQKGRRRWRASWAGWRLSGGGQNRTRG